MFKRFKYEGTELNMQESWLRQNTPCSTGGLSTIRSTPQRRPMRTTA